MLLNSILIKQEMYEIPGKALLYVRRIILLIYFNLCIVLKLFSVCTRNTSSMSLMQFTEAKGRMVKSFKHDMVNGSVGLCPYVPSAHCTKPGAHIF